VVLRVKTGEDNFDAGFVRNPAHDFEKVARDTPDLLQQERLLVEKNSHAAYTPEVGNAGGSHRHVSRRLQRDVPCRTRARKFLMVRRRPRMRCDTVRASALVLRSNASVNLVLSLEAIRACPNTRK
jgi:hypothetical protein